jgi:cohesin loading factor subunit SCC2
MRNPCILLLPCYANYIAYSIRYNIKKMPHSLHIAKTKTKIKTNNPKKKMHFQSGEMIMHGDINFMGEAQVSAAAQAAAQAATLATAQMQVQPMVHAIPRVQATLYGPDGLPRPTQLLAAIEDEEDDEEDEETVLDRLPENTRLLREYITASQGFLLLLTLRQHLKDLYGFSDAKISQYSPSESAKVYEKALNRKSNQLFKPKSTLQRLKENKSDDQELNDEGRRQLVKEYLDFKQLMLKFDPDDPDDEEEDHEGGHKRGTIANSSEPDRLNPSAGGMAQIEAIPIQYQVHQVPEHPNNSIAQSEGPPRVPKLTIHASHHQQQQQQQQQQHHHHHHHHHQQQQQQQQQQLQQQQLQQHAPTDKEHHRKHRAHKADKPKKHKKKKRRRLSDSSESGEDCSDPDFLV